MAEAEPLYGVNTGFGSLAGVRIRHGGPARGAAEPDPVARLGRRRRRCRWTSVRAMLAPHRRLARAGSVRRAAGRRRAPDRAAQRGHHPRGAGARLGGRLGRSRATRPRGAGADRRRRGLARRRAHQRPRGARAARPRPARAGGKGGPGADQRHASDGGARRRWRWRTRSACSPPRCAPPPCRPTPAGVRTPTSTSACTLARGQAGQTRGRRRACARCSHGSEIVPSHLHDDPRVQDPVFAALCASGARRLPRRAALQPLGRVERELGAVTDNPLVFDADARGRAQGGGGRQLPRHAARARARHLQHRAHATWPASPSGASTTCWRPPARRTG